MGKPSARRLRGIGFEVESMMKLFLVIIIGLAIVILIIAASGTISSLLSEFCASNPSICGGQDPNSQKNYASAKASINALVCAINSVGRGQDMCGAFSATAPSTTTQSIGRNFGLTGFAVGTQTSPSVQCQEKSQTTEAQSVSTVYASDSSSADPLCKSFCSSQNTQCVTANAPKQYIDYNAVRPAGTLLECTCEYGSNSKTVYGLDRTQANRMCLKEAGKTSLLDISLYGCKEKVDSVEYNNLFSERPLLIPKNDLYSNVKKYECTFSGSKGTETYYSYGAGNNPEAQAKKICQNDAAMYSNPVLAFDEGKFRYVGEVTGPTLFFGLQSTTGAVTRKNPLDGYECTKKTTTTSKSLSCTVSNFQLPQRVEDKQLWGITYGDPQFIAYWQVFPLEADTWSFQVDWKIHTAIALVTILPPTKVAAGLSKLGMANIAASITGKEAETTLVKELANIVKQRATLKGGVKALTKAGVLEGAVLAAEYAASTRAKFYPDKNSFVMKSPYEKKEPFPLASELEGKPVFIVWPTKDILSIAEAIDTAHFVSPCEIQSMSVGKGSVICDQYFFDAAGGIVQCIKLSDVEYSGMSTWTNLLPKIKSYVSSIFSSGSEPACDIRTYIGAGEPYINDIGAIKAAAAGAVAQRLFNSNAVQPKSCDDVKDSDAIPVILGGRSYMVNGCYKNNPAKFDKIEIKDGNKAETLLDTNFDGTFDSYMLKGCKTDAVIISNVKKAAASNDYNYCFDETARVLSWGQFATYAAGAGTSIVMGATLPVSAPLAAIGAMAFNIYAVQAGTYEAITAYDQARNKWPG